MPDESMKVEKIEAGFYGDSTGGTTRISIQTDKSFSLVDIDRYKTSTMEIKHLDIAESEQGKGLGTKCFSNIVESARLNNIKEIDLIAAKGDGYNGYNTWARYGFNIKENYGEELEKFSNLVKNSGISEIKEAHNLNDLMKTSSGRSFWREKGFEFHGRFNVDKDYNTFKEYRKEKLHE